MPPPEPADDLPAFLAALEIEMLREAADGRPPPLERYLARYPEHEAAVRECHARLAGPGSESAEDTALASFRARYRADRAAGAVRPLADYLRVFPGAELRIAEHYAALEADRPAPPAAVAADADLPPGTRLGPYHVERRIGRGGQGSVYEGHDTRLQRRVAIKVLDGIGRLPAETMHRFEREARLASALDHPGICAVYDSGADRGIAYIVMRFVDGETLARGIERARVQGATWLDSLPASGEAASEGDGGRGPTSSRSRIPRIALLFERIARALHAAHRAGVVHRDLKPQNVMVQPDGRPVILDFGLARATEPDSLLLSRTGDVLGTPAYMAPEQITAGSEQSDARTDVYALGVCLYETLTLRRPFEAPTREALYRAVLHQEPPRARRLRPGLPRDLEVVVATALEKEPDRRYADALELAEDLRRVRCREPIRARPPGLALRVWRWRQRHPALAAAVALFVLGAAALAWQQWRAIEAISSARDEAVAVNDFLTERLILGVTPKHGGAEVTVAEVLDAASASVETSFPEPSPTGATVRSLLAEANALLNRWPEAHRWARAAHAMRRDVLGPDHPDTLASAQRLGRALMEVDRHDEAERWLRDVLARSRRALGEDAPLTLGTRSALGDLAFRRGDFAAAARRHRTTLEAYERVHGPDHRDTLGARQALARALAAQGKHAEAEELMRSVLAARHAAFGDDDFEVLRSQNDLASLLHDQRRWDEAEALYRACLAGTARVYGKDSWDWARSLNNLASLLQDRGLAENDDAALDRAEAMLAESIAVRAKVLSPDHSRVATAHNNLGLLLYRRGRQADAEPHLRRAVGIRTERLGADHPATLQAAYNHAANLRRLEGAAAALPVLRDTVARARRTLDDGSSLLTRYLLLLGVCSLEAGTLEEAEAILRETHARAVAAGDADSDLARTAAGYLARTFETLDRPADAERWERRSAEGR